MTHWDILASPNSVGANVFWRSVHIAQVNVMCYQFPNFCFFRIWQIEKPLLYEVNGTSCSFDSLKISPVSADLTPWLEEPIKFDYKAGKVGKIYCKKDEPEYILNIKRGILAMFHHNFTNPDPADNYVPRMYKNWEVKSYFVL